MYVISDFMQVFTSYFAVMNPIANTPIFIALTSSIHNPHHKSRVALYSLSIACFIVGLFVFFGREVLSVFHITLPAVRLSGGIILFFIGYDMLKGRHDVVSSKKIKKLAHADPEADDDDSVGKMLSIIISPLAIPMLAGPGTVTVSLSFVTDSISIYHDIGVFLAFVVLCVVSYLFFVFGERLFKNFGESIVRGITRFMGMIVAILGAQMLINTVINVAKMHLL